MSRIRLALNDFYDPGTASNRILPRGFRLRMGDAWPQIWGRRGYGSLVDVDKYPYDGDVAGIGPTWVPDYPSSYNQASVWGTGTYLEYLTTIGGVYGTKGMYHSNATANTSVSYTSTFTLGANAPFILAAVRYGLPEGQTTDELKIVHDRMELRFTGSGTYLKLGDIEQTISLSLDSDTLNEILFVPESHGVLRIQKVGESTPVIVADPTLVKNRSYGQTVIGSAGFTISTTGGQFLWRLGVPVVAAEATASLVIYPNPGAEYTGITAPTVVVRSETPTGTTVEVDEVAAGDGRTNLVATFTSDGTRFPILHAVELYQAGNERTGVTSGVGLPVWDSEDHLQSGDISIFRTMDITHEASENGMARDMSVTIDILDGNYIESGLSDLDPGPSNRVVDVEFAETTVLKGGIIARESLINVAKTGSVPEHKAPTSRQIEVRSPLWKLRRQKIVVNPSFDGGHLGQLIITTLQDQGWKESEYSQVSASDGGYIEPSAALEDWAEYAQSEVMVFDYIDRALTKYGDGKWQFYWDNVNGSFTLSERILISTPGSFKFYFGNGAPLSGGTFGGKPLFPIFDNIELPNDYSDIYNVQTVYGAEDAETKERIAVTMRHWESRQVPTDPAFIGCWRHAPAHTDEGIKTKAEATRRCRALLRESTQPARFGEIETVLIANLWQDDRIWLNTDAPYPVKVHRILNAGLQDGFARMSFVYRHLRT